MTRLDTSIFENNGVWAWHWWIFVYPTCPPITVLSDFFVNWIFIFKSVIRFSILHEEASENHLVCSDYLCPRKQWFSMSRFKRTRNSVASIKITLLLLSVLLRRRLSDDAWTVILVVPSTTAFHAQATRSSSSSKVTKVVGGPYAGQGTMGLQLWERGEIDVGWRVGGGGGSSRGKRRAAQSLVGSRTME